MKRFTIQMQFTGYQGRQVIMFVAAFNNPTAQWVRDVEDAIVYGSDERARRDLAKLEKHSNYVYSVVPIERSN
jgi:hypothetical protein